MVLYTALATFQVSNTTAEFKNTTDYYSYFLSIASLIFLIKVFLLGYKTIFSKYIQSKISLFFINIILTAGSIWIINSANLSLTWTSYPKDYFSYLLVGSVFFLVLTILNKTNNIIRSTLFSILFYLIIFILLSFQFFNFETLFFQLTSFLVILFELIQIIKVLNWQFKAKSQLEFE
ncbi:MAG: hypothetical protein HC932_04525 [Thermales bacterium]|nr:hypothetical protein [Thermales bacterium]